MSRILKRPMFRKGGEVMEGIMTGIKPRKMFSLGALSAADQEIVSDVERKMKLINAVGGGSPLSDPLTQFLLTAGPDLVAGKAAGGTKLQEILGGIKPGLDRAVKTQQLKDLSNRKLATALISKSKVSDTRKLYDALKNRINPKTGKLFTLEDVAGDKAMADLYRKETSETEKQFQREKETFKNLASVKSFTGTRKYEPIEIKLIETANKQIDNDPTLFAAMDESNPYVQREDIKKERPTPVKTGKKDKDGKEITLDVVIPDDPDDFAGNRVYFVVPERKFFYFDAQKNRLVEYKRGG
tara:strand:+ start:374 stop:1267 length:894 start_codon:yes stop_codon:yes gene_type:complete